MEEREQKVYEALQRLNIQYAKREHPAVFTCEEADLYTKDLPGVHTKNLFLRNKKGNHHYLVVMEDKKSLNVKEFETKIGEKNLSFASAERLAKYLGLEQGAVSLFGIINDSEHAVKVYVDDDILNADEVNCHPNVNTATLTISTADMKKFLDMSGNDWDKIAL